MTPKTKITVEIRDHSPEVFIGYGLYVSLDEGHCVIHNSFGGIMNVVHKDCWTDISVGKSY